ncbi:putative threonine efflux protein [Hahella chejuensis KCTC 2396]|uniref:Putative threonine efflux protein n=1 Tax=Hahella chejuensis (strain KCTC 2396) TaxID=349521 RepID=Q2SFE2_HAHCH|nr:LysE family translocator [Hahella chejuensis]ABC30632.1 putative threonine efflux protein [Hahella chejuensis KCTC 2396]
MLLSFIVATALITLAPGPSMLLVIANTLRSGLGQGIYTSLGVVVADAILLCLTVSGLGALVQTSAWAFNLLKWFGVAYLAYLGVRQLCSQPSAEDLSGATEVAKQNPFKQGLGVTLLNPKIIGFFIAFFPQFLDASAPVGPQLMTLGPLFLVIVFLILAGYAMAANRVRRWLAGAQAQSVLNKSSGVALLVCGAAAGLTTR